MSSESDSAEEFEELCRNAVTQLDQVIYAIKALGNRNGSTRDEICDYLVSRDLMNARISKALVAKALYKGMDEGLIRRPKGTNQFVVIDKMISRHRGHSPRRSTAKRKSDHGHKSDKRHGSSRHDGHHHSSHKSHGSHGSHRSHRSHKSHK